MSDVFGRIRKPPAKELIEAQEELESAQHLKDSLAQFPHQLLIHKAHVLMLVEQGILIRDEAAAIFKALSSLEEEIKNEPDLSIYMKAEAYVIKHAGPAGGKMHIGRSRNDLKITAMRMYLRDRINEIIQNLIEFRKVLLRLAKRNIYSIMPGYTHWQHAQPVTFAHYILAHADACERCVERFENAYKLTNLSTLGAAALAGTSWGIDRHLTAELLGFDGLLENTYDCVASRDFIFDTASATAILMSNISRLSEDLEIWASVEFSMIELPEEYSGTSSIMPQKKNPIIFERSRAHAASIIGYLTGILCSMKGVSYTNIRDTEKCISMVRRMLDETIYTLRVIRGALYNLTINKETMLERATKGFSTMTDLADTIVRDRGLSFRLAHEIIAHVVTKAIKMGLNSDEITSNLVDEGAIEVIGKKLKLSDDNVRLMLDPMETVKLRKTIGGPAPCEVTRMINDRWRKVNEEEKRLNEREIKLKKAYKKIENMIISTCI